MFNKLFGREKGNKKAPPTVRDSELLNWILDLNNSVLSQQRKARKLFLLGGKAGWGIERQGFCNLQGYIILRRNSLILIKFQFLFGLICLCIFLFVSTSIWHKSNE